jgi:hypothetical protein
LRAVGLPDHYESNPYTAHATRRSFATWLTEAGVAESTIKRLMGHAGSGVTQQHYTAQSHAILRAGVEAIQMDLSTGQVIALPMQAVAASPESSKTDGLTADFTADRGKHLAKSTTISLERDTGLEPATFGLGSRRSTN